VGRKALLVIDMLNDFVRKDGALPVPFAEELIEPIKKTIERFRSRKLPVIYVCDSHMPDDEEFKVWGEHAVKGSYGARVVEELSPENSDVIIYKRRFSGFFGTDLDLTLKEKGIEEVVLTGVLTNICVLYTGSDAYQLGYRVTVLKDCVGAADSSMHEFALRQLKEVVGAEVIGSKDLEL
jgi:nicotinamidase-related amidase